MLAWSATATGRRDDALALFEQSVDERDPVFGLMARYWPDLAPVRSHPRFQALLQKMNFPAAKADEPASDFPAATAD